MGSAPDVKLVLENKGAMKRAFDELPRRVQEKGLKASATAGGTVITRTMRRLVPVESGLTKRSVTKKVKVYRDKEIAVSISGADVSVEGEYRGNLRKPSKYWHIINAGAKAHGKHPAIEGMHFVEQAEQQSGDAALEAAQSKLAEVVNREVDKLRSGG